MNDENPYRSPRAECGRIEIGLDWVPAFTATSTITMTLAGFAGNVSQFLGYDRLAAALIYSSVGCLMAHLAIVAVALFFSWRSR